MANVEEEILFGIDRSALSERLVEAFLRLARSDDELRQLVRDFASDSGVTSPGAELFKMLEQTIDKWVRRSSRDLQRPARRTRAPFGYRTIQGELAVHPANGPILKAVYELYWRHQNFSRVIEELNRRGYRASGGKLFTKARITRIIRDPTSLGTVGVYASGQPLDRTPLVDFDLWVNCNRLLDVQNKTRTPS